MEKATMEMKRMLEEDNYKYLIVISSVRFDDVKTIEANTLKEVWEELWNIGGIDLGKYVNDNKYKEDGMFFLREPNNYRKAIEKYMIKNDEFCYKKFKLSLSDEEKIKTMREIIWKTVPFINDGEVISELYSDIKNLDDDFKEKGEVSDKLLTDLKKDLSLFVIEIDNLSLQEELITILKELSITPPKQ